MDIDDVREAPQPKLTFVVDQEKAAINGVTTEQIAGTLQTLLQGASAGTFRSDTERNPLRIELRLPTAQRSGAADLARIHVSGDRGELVPLAELGRWETSRVDQTIYHKSLQPVAYVFAETAGRPPADVVVDVLADKNNAAAAADRAKQVGNGWLTEVMRRDGRNLHSARSENAVIHRPACSDARHPPHGSGGHAWLLAAQCPECSAARRIPRSRLYSRPLR